MKETPPNWYRLSTDATFKTLSCTPKGLSQHEAERRLKLAGPNTLPAPQRHTVLKRLLTQFHNVLIYVLLVVMITTGLLGHWIDTAVIAGVVTINAIIGFIQEGRAENAVNAIHAMLSPTALVIRDGQQRNLDAESLVMGDIVLLQPGDRVPADIRLFRCKGLQIAEAALTGESLTIEKITTPINEVCELADRRCMAYSGTLVTHGQGTGIVVATGINTELGKISTLVSHTEGTTTPLLRQIAQFSHFLTTAILLIALTVFVFGIVIRNYPLTDIFLAAVSLAVAAIPEGLPAIMTITLAIGVERMAKRNAFIRRLPAVETLGAVTVICTDKTGTLTRNEMTVRKIVTTANNVTLSGTGYDPHGALTIAQQAIYPEQHPILMETVRAAVLCNDAELVVRGDNWQLQGDPMEGALLVAGMKAGIATDTAQKSYPRTDLIPFESEHRFMATLHHSHREEAFIVVKGAPEQILDMCQQQRSPMNTTDVDVDFWQQQIDQMADNGLRVLAIAYRPTNSNKRELYFSDIDNDMIMLGLFGLIDPPRAEAIKAIEACNSAGIRVKMITGDHALTARAIARQLGLVNTEQVLTGQQMDQLNNDELFEIASQIDIYARVSPVHKMRLVETLQQHNEIVAMTGDGVNDAPALKHSDIGTAMGKNGTAAAREAAEMILADDNFASITAAVEEGRAVYDNLKKAILFILPTNGGEALIILAAVLLGFEAFPLTPVQILWVNMVTAVTLALSLAFEPKETDLMQRHPRPPAEPILTSHLVWRICFVSVVLMGATLILFQWEIAQSNDIDKARTVAINTLVMCEIFYLFNSRYILKSVFSVQGLTGNIYVVVAIGLLAILQCAFTYIPAMQLLFGTRPLEASLWVPIVLISSSVLFLVELEKWLLRRYKK